MKERVFFAMPLISLALFFTSGLVWERWGLGVSFFLLIPLSTLLLSKNPLRRVEQFMPLIALMLFLWIWLGLDRPHPGWVVFLLIPLSHIFFNKRLDPRSLVAFGVTALYVVLGIALEGFWHPGWLIFFLVPIVNTIFFPAHHGFKGKAGHIPRGRRIFDVTVGEFLQGFSGLGGPFRHDDAAKKPRKGDKADEEGDDEKITVDVEIK